MVTCKEPNYKFKILVGREPKSTSSAVTAHDGNGRSVCCFSPHLFEIVAVFIARKQRYRVLNSGVSGVRRPQACFGAPSKLSIQSWSLCDIFRSSLPRNLKPMLWSTTSRWNRRWKNAPSQQVCNVSCESLKDVALRYEKLVHYEELDGASDYRRTFVAMTSRRHDIVVFVWGEKFEPTVPFPTRPNTLGAASSPSSRAFRFCCTM